jgi:hypothetical protein
LSKKDTSNNREVSISRNANYDKYACNTDIRELQQRHELQQHGYRNCGTGTHQEQKVTEGMPAIVGTPAEGMPAIVGTPAAAMTPKTGGMPGTAMKQAINTPTKIRAPSKVGTPTKKHQ